jgi:hypothetical protein
MKVSRKLKDDFKVLRSNSDEEIHPSLMLRDLKKPIKGLEAGQDFQGHIKGKCRSHEVRNNGEGESHHYDLDVHDFEHHGGGDVKQKKAPIEEVGEAMDKFDKEQAEKKKPKKEEKKAEKK